MHPLQNQAGEINHEIENGPRQKEELQGAMKKPSAGHRLSSWVSQIGEVSTLVEDIFHELSLCLGSNEKAAVRLQCPFVTIMVSQCFSDLSHLTANHIGLFHTKHLTKTRPRTVFFSPAKQFLLINDIALSNKVSKGAHSHTHFLRLNFVQEMPMRLQGKETERICLSSNLDCLFESEEVSQLDGPGCLPDIQDLLYYTRLVTPHRTIAHGGKDRKWWSYDLKCVC